MNIDSNVYSADVWLNLQYGFLYGWFEQIKAGDFPLNIKVATKEDKSVSFIARDIFIALLVCRFLPAVDVVGR